MDKFKELKVLISLVEEDIIKFYDKGNSKAGVRVTTSLQELKKIAQEVRLEILSIKKANKK
jgi:hypothetical protein